MSSKKHVVKGKKSKPKNHKGEQKKLYSFAPAIPRNRTGIKNSQISFVLHECIRRVLKRHGPKKRWHPFANMRLPGWTLVSDEKLADPSTDNDMALAGSLVSLNTVYDFRLVPNATTFTFLASTAGGLISGFQNADPSGGAGSTWTASEWAALISLFSEVKMKSFEMHFWPINLSSTAAGTALLGNGLCISGVLSTVAAAPGATNVVLDNADAVIYKFQNDYSDKVFVHRVKGTDLSWAIVTTPNPGSFAGVPGSIQYFGDGFIHTTALIFYTLVGFYSFRSRI